ncbi:DCLRE1C [Bugula neritina]|uniref:Protein artemis n=1 Tax=Bugula neritina TaxID=10212 RepID=A0A7J7JG25_BUGNE|nr:DCLRE1C [Bugula neritina]
MSAGHCPGSAMLLIEGADGTVLYTGDFRLDKGAASLLPALHDSFGGVKKVDHLYCDTTFLTRKTMNIVSRAECEEEIVEQVKSHISRGNNYHVVLKTKAKLGYENVYRILYERFRMKTHVRAEDAEVYSGIPEINEIVTLDNRTQVHTCWRSVQGGGLQDKNAAGLVSHGGCDTLNRPGVEVKVIHLSTMWFALTENKHTSVKVDSDTVRCCYSFHSSYSEIEDFIRYINPCYAYPNVLPMDATMEQTQHLLNSFLSKRADDASPELCQTNSWKSVHEIDSWWIAEKRSTNNTGFSSPKKPKLENEDNGSEQSTPTGSREATPELSLWSDSSDLENETPADAD